MKQSTSNTAVDEVFAIRVADLLRVASLHPAISPGLRLAFRRAAEQVEAGLRDIERERQAA